MRKVVLSAIPGTFPDFTNQLLGFSAGYLPAHGLQYWFAGVLQWYVEIIADFRSLCHDIQYFQRKFGRYA
jgi:hypothetical protein